MLARPTLRTARMSNGASARLLCAGRGARRLNSNVARAIVSLGSPTCPFSMSVCVGYCRSADVVRV